MVEAVAKKPGILDRAKNSITTFLSGYSPEDVESARRILNGGITPEDRIEYKTNETTRICLLGLGLYAHTNPHSLDPELTSGRINTEAEIAKIQVLTDERIDPILQFNAQRILKSCGKL